MRLPNDKDWNDSYDAHKSFHVRNQAIITGHVVKIVLASGNKFEILQIYLEGIDSTNEYGFKCNVDLTVRCFRTGLDSLAGIPQEQVKWVQVGNIVSVSYKKTTTDDDFSSGMFCVNHNDWDNQKSRIDSRLHEAVRGHAKEALRYKNRVRSWWKQNGVDAKLKIYRISEYNPISYNTQVAQTIQRKLAKDIRRQYEDSIIVIREGSKERFNKLFNDWSIKSIMETLTIMRDQSFRIKVCERRFTDVIEYIGSDGLWIPIPPKVGEIGYVWH